MRIDAAAGVFIGALVVLVVSLKNGWGVLTLLAAAVMVGTLAATAAARRDGPPPDFTIQPGGEERHWRTDQKRPWDPEK